MSDKKVVYIDLDDTTCDYTLRKNEFTELFPEVTYPQSTIGFFEDLEPIDYSLCCIAQIIDCGKYDVWIATAPSVKNLHCYSEKAKWVLDYLGEEMQEKMIIINDKSKLKGDFLIDDLEAGKGQENFEGELIVYGSDKWQTWIDITVYLVNL